MHSFFTKLFNSRRSPLRKARVQPSFEVLEDRRVPVVGAFAIPGVVDPTSWMNGVVAIDAPNNGFNSTRSEVDPNGTGALLWTGRHILTVWTKQFADYSALASEDVPQDPKSDRKK